MRKTSGVLTLRSSPRKRGPSWSPAGACPRECGDGNERERRLSLLVGRAHHQAVKLLAHLDLARQPRIRPHVVAEIEHVFFHRRGIAGLGAPGFVDIDMAGGAGTGAAAFGLDAGML